MPLNKPLTLASTLVAGLALASCSATEQPRQTQTTESVVEFFPAKGKMLSISRVPLDAGALARGNRLGLLPADAKAVIEVQGALRHGEYIWSDTAVPQGPLTVWIDLRRQVLSVYRSGQEIGTAAVVYGAPSYPTPAGQFTVRRMIPDYRSRNYDAPMPFAMFINDQGVALHGSPMEADHATHGCVGLPLPFAKLLFAAAAVGDRVYITRSSAVTS